MSKQHMSMSQYYGLQKCLDKDKPGFKIIESTIEIGERAKGRQNVWLNYGNRHTIWTITVDFTINQIQGDPRVFL